MAKPEIPAAIKDFFENSLVPLSLSDATHDDEPIILANEAFYTMTGYTPKEVLGRNCRFLQGAKPQTAVREKIRKNLETSDDVQALITNYRKSGEAFDNYLFIFTIFDTEGQPQFRIGSQFDVPSINKIGAFEEHTKALYDGIEDMNAECDETQQKMVYCGELLGLSVKELITARLDAIKQVD